MSERLAQAHPPRQSVALSTSGSEAHWAHLGVLSWKAVLRRPGLPHGPVNVMVMDSQRNLILLNSGHQPAVRRPLWSARSDSLATAAFECCTALEIIPSEERIFAPAYRNTMEGLKLCLLSRVKLVYTEIKPTHGSCCSRTGP